MIGSLQPTVLLQSSLILCRSMNEERERVRKLDPVDGGIDNNGSRLCI